MSEAKRIAMRALSKRGLARATTMFLVLAGLMAGCTAPAGHPALDQAGAAVERARSAPRVRALAAAELDRAEVALERARAAARAGAPPDQLEHLAYVVSQRAALAETRAAERVARSEVGRLQRAVGQVPAQGRLEQHGRARAPVRDEQRRRALAEVDMEQDRQGLASSERPAQPTRVQQARDQAAEGQPSRAPLEGGQHARASLEATRANLRKAQQAAALSEQDQRERGSVQDGRQIGAPFEKALPEPAPAQGDRQVYATLELGQEPASTQDERQASAPLELRQQPASVQEHPPAGGRLEKDARERASVRDNEQARARVDDQRESPSAQDERQAGAPLKLGQEPASVRERGQPSPPPEGDARERASVRDDGQARARVDDQRESASAQDEREASAPLKLGQEPASVRERGQPSPPPEGDARERALPDEDELTRAAAAKDGAAVGRTMPERITLALAQLPFDGPEPTDDAIEQLTALAERLVREPERSVSIEVDFELPDPEARTLVERRVEVVRAILTRRGIEPARLAVRAANKSPAEPADTRSVGAPRG